MDTNVKEETRRSSSVDILSSFRPSTSTNCGNTDNGEAFATTVGKHNLSSGSILLIRTGYHSDKRLQNDMAPPETPILDGTTKYPKT